MSVAAMESPGASPESPFETADDVVYTCKGCGEILEEGKAFELAGNRWHIECFRCNTCGTPLDSDANLLLLGDGSLICNNCTYSCSSCGNKIEDLAILTGEQAFCSACFRCRNCKRKIENLRYARTSQGIFCMSCHESLMARRRKKSRAAAAAAISSGSASSSKPGSNAQSPMLLDKSLPSLPPNVMPQAVESPDHETPSSDVHFDTPTELSPRPRPPTSRQASSRSRTRERSPLAYDGQRSEPTSAPSQHKTSYQPSETSATVDDSLDIPFVLDTGMSPESSRPPIRRRGQDSVKYERDARGPERERDRERDYSREPGSDRDYFGSHKLHNANGQPGGNNKYQISSPPSSRDQESRSTSKAGTPHIPFPERERQSSSEHGEMPRNKDRRGFEPPPSGPPPRSDSRTKEGITLPSTSARADDARVQHANPNILRTGNLSTTTQGENFKLQEVPKTRKNGSISQSPKTDGPSPPLGKSFSAGLSRSASGPEMLPERSSTKDSLKAPSPRSDATKPFDSSVQTTESPRGSSDSRNQSDVGSATTGQPSSASQLLNKPKRGDSLQYSQNLQAKSSKRDASGVSTTKSSPESANSQEEVSPVLSGVATQDSQSDVGSSDSPLSGNKAKESASQLHPDPQRSEGTTRPPINKIPTGDSFTSPRPAPPLPTAGQATTDAEKEEERDGSPGLPRGSLGAEFTLDDDMARILGSKDEASASILRRVSNVVRHGRSHSDMDARARGSAGRWPKSPGSAGMHSPYPKDISSPTTSPVALEENVALKNELRRSAQKIAELELRVHSTADIKTLDTKLREKRSTVAFLDTQKEIMVRELEVLTEHVADMKKNSEPFDFESLTSKVVREFAMSLQRLKDTYAPEIEALIHKKNTLTEETTSLARLRDQAIQETEQLNSKNAQLADLNNELTQQIQERYRANRDHDGGKVMSNGLGIYSNHSKERSDASMDVGREARTGASQGQAPIAATPGALPEHGEAEATTVVTTPHVVNLRKGQVKKFNWKKGGQTVAKGVSKGLKGAFSSNAPYQYQYQRDGQSIEGTPYGSTPQDSPNGLAPPPRLPHDPNKQQGLGFFGQRLAKGNKPYSSSQLTTWAPEPPTTLFGSDLGERADHERRQIPSVVTRCIEEVELRGMDVEGIYRKTGGNSQVKALQEGFERTIDFDISDPGLDVTAVTSVLKQYFRKLPNPLMTYEAYDRMIETNNIEDEEKRQLAMRFTVQALPPKHHDCLEFLIFHLARVADREKENLMTPKNLAVVFAPTIMRDTSLEREMLDMHSKNMAIQYLIENYKTVFPGS